MKSEQTVLIALPDHRDITGILYSWNVRLFRLAVVALGTILLAGCTATGPDANTTPSLDFSTPGTAADMVDTLMAAAGSTRVVNVELTRTEARVSVVTGVNVTTYAYRDQKISPVDSDITYVGQAIFDPRTFNLADLGSLFSQAATVSGSQQGQQLQIVDYDNGNIYMNVTTNPETLPVFFTPDGTLVRTVDPTAASDLATELTDVLPAATTVVRVGIASDLSMYADLPAGQDQIMHVVRAPRFPVRDQLKAESSQPLPFDSSPVTASAVTTILVNAADHLDRPLSAGFELTIERRADDTTPTATVTMAGKTVHLSLAGDILPS